MKKKFAILACSASALACVTNTSGATAQVPAIAATAAEQNVPVEEIVVTGSRLGRTSFDSPTPVNVVGEARMKELALPSVAEALNQLPSFRATTTPSSNLFRISGAIGANSVDLRGLGSSRTLVLVDGRRFVPSSDNGTVDLNGVPSALVRRAEVVTGGASATYGANAVAGVVNLILDTRYKGFKTEFSSGISERGDAVNHFLSATAGFDFGGGRGHVIAGAEYQINKGVGACETRDWCHRYTNYVTNPGYLGGVSTNGLPATLVLDNVLFVYNPTGILVSAVQTVGGVRTTLGQQVGNTGATRLPAGLQNLQFNNSASALIPFQFGNLLSGTFMQGGDPSVAALYGFGDVPLVVPTSHYSGFAHAEYELTDDIKVFAEGLYSFVKGGPTLSQVLVESPAGGTAGLSINNPYITPTVRAQILAVNPNITQINVNVAKPETGSTAIGVSKNKVYRFVGGLSGKIFSTWSWDASYEHGETRGRATTRNTRFKPIDGQAANAIAPPAGYTGTIFQTPAGAPVICSSSATAPNDGCVPVNLLGLNSLTPAQLAASFGDEFQTRKIKQDVAAANVRGPLFEIWAGSVSAAVGAEWRRDTAEGSIDAQTAAGLFAVPQATLLPKVRTEVVEAYAEVSIPLLRESALGKSLSTDAAVRQTHYNSFGNATTWKVGVQYEPIDDVLFRVTKSRDIRAPTPAELNPNTITNSLPLNDPFINSNHIINNVLGGNANLQLEKAKTFTAGIVLKPSFLPRFRLSTDYYNINVSGAIDSLSGPTILTACFSQNLLCNLITFAGAPKASAAASVLTNFQNLSNLRARGLEFVAEYSIPNVIGGTINIQANANYVIKLESVGATGLVTKLDGVTGNAGSLTNIAGVPTYKLDGVVTYSRPQWSVTAHGRYVPRSILDPTKIGPEDDGYNINLASSVTTNRVDARFYLDLSWTIRPSVTASGRPRFELFGSVSNVFDKGQPKQLRLFGNPLQYDVVGRAYRLGVRTNL